MSFIFLCFVAFACFLFCSACFLWLFHDTFAGRGNYHNTRMGRLTYGIKRALLF